MANQYADNIREELTSRLQPRLLGMCIAFVAADNLGFRIRLLPAGHDNSGRRVAVWLPAGAVAAAVGGGRGGCIWYHPP